MDENGIGGFNTTLQDVDAKYAWINDMIKSRQELVLMYMKLLQLGPDGSLERASPSATKEHFQCYPSYEEITSFCDHLIDYVSHGHFDLYPKIVELMENASGRSLSIARRVMPKIENTTEFLMRFNDRYSEELNEKKLKTLKHDLAQVGACLEQRFRNEDRLIIGLKLVHSIVATPKLK